MGFQRVQHVRSARALRAHQARNGIDLSRIQSGSGGKIAAFVAPARAQKVAHTGKAQPVIFVHGAQNGQSARLIIGLLGTDANALQQPVHNFAVVDAYQIIACFNAQRRHAIGGHHANFGIGAHIARAHRIGINL